MVLKGIGKLYKLLESGGEGVGVIFVGKLSLISMQPFLGSHFTIWFSASKQALNKKKTSKDERSIFFTFSLCDCVHCQSLVVGFFCRDQWSIGGEWIMDSWIRHLSVQKELRKSI